MDRELAGFRDLILWVYDNHQRPDNYDNNTAIEIYLKLKGIEPFAHRRELEECIPTETQVRRAFPWNKYIYLNPVEKGTVIVPVLRLKSDFGCDPPEVRFRLGLFLLHEGELKAFGFRYESPEGPGRHHYYHAQVITDLGPHSARQFWLPVSQPAFPLDTDHPISLLVSMLISLYGLDCVGEITSSLNNKVVNICISEMFCQRIPRLQYFWRVKMRSPDKPALGYSTSLSEEKFREYVQKKWTGCEIEGMTKREYDSFRPKYRYIYPD